MYIRTYIRILLHLLDNPLTELTQSLSVSLKPSLLIPFSTFRVYNLPDCKLSILDNLASLLAIDAQS